MSTQSSLIPRLTSLSHGGGCGCKIEPQLLREIIADAITHSHVESNIGQLLVANDTSDDAAVYHLNDEQMLVATTDFFMPIVDDAYDFGRIAAANALSDIYAMGASPIFALNIVGMPVDKIPTEIIAKILAGGADICRQAGIAIAGGHSISSSEPIYGLSVTGIASAEQIKRNSQAQVNDVLILSKPLGIGVLAAAFKKEKLSAAAYQELIHYTTQLNQIGQDLGKRSEIHAMTDVTGFGLLGHLLEVCQASQLGALIAIENIPIIEFAATLAQQGIITGASEHNWQSCLNHVNDGNQLETWRKNILHDPQTSGGLLLTCDSNAVDEILSLFHDAGFDYAAQIGVMCNDNTKITLV